MPTILEESAMNRETIKIHSTTTLSLLASKIRNLSLPVLIFTEALLKTIILH
jgi:hypothetical protein